ncbi:MAG: prepilin-type N-terminal cleavage/methylation domain-containing protein [Planctomycetota bacterium]
MATPPSPRSAGFTLIEVLVALGVLSLGIASAIALFAAATASHKRAIHYTNAAAIAEYALADVETALSKGAPLLLLEQQPPFAAVQRDYPGYDVAVRFLISVESPDQVLAEVTVSWVAGGRDVEEQFRQWMTRETRIYSPAYREDVGSVSDDG